MLVKTGSADVAAEGGFRPGALTPAHPKRKRVTKIIDTTFTGPANLSCTVTSQRLFSNHQQTKIEYTTV
jgi:hypothetical protein